MPQITFGETVIHCKKGRNLREVLLRYKLPLYHAGAKPIHCRGLGTCGTCAIKIEGDVSPMTKVEQWRLGFPPHKKEQPLRLACQCSVEGDLTIEKWKGFWGQTPPEKTAK